MFKKIKILLLNFFWRVYSTFLSTLFIYFIIPAKHLFTFSDDLVGIFSIFYSKFLLFFGDLKFFVINFFSFMGGLLFKHRLAYILRLLLLIFLLYKPILLDLDSIYWIFSVIFYFFSNSLFFLVAYTMPLWHWSFTAPSLKVLLMLSLLPALYSAKRLKKRLRKKRKIVLQDNEILFIFQWVQRFFVFTIYVSVCYFFFFFFSFLLPFIYLWLSGSVSINLVYFILNPGLSKILFTIPPFFFYLKIIFLKVFLFFNLYFFFFLFLFFQFFFNLFSTSFFSLFSLILLVFKTFSFSFFCLAKHIIAFLFLFYGLIYTFEFNSLIEIYKNFLFSDNFLILFSDSIYFLLSNLLSFFFSAFYKALIPAYLITVFSDNYHYFCDFFLSYLYSFLIFFLDNTIYYSSTYLSNLTFFGLLSTWYEYLNQNVQKGSSSNSIINWMLIHLYASIIAFWFLDFDFRVSVKTPPKTPNTLLREAKKTQDWIPKNMDFLTLQTMETKIYFAMLDISFEHVESLHFIYGDFEYVDEEFDHEDETPDEEDFYNESDETLKVREIIDSDLGFTKRPVKMSELDPLDSKSSMERHYLSEIVGEPELIFIEEPLRWAFSSIYSPNFDDLHFKDSLFSEWVFDPDEDLTFFEFLFLFPFLFFCIYIWFFHRRRRRHFRSYLRFFIPSRRTVFSGWWFEDILGFPLGERIRYFFDKMRHHTAPDVKFKRVHKFRMYRNRQKFKIMQLETYHFDRLRLTLYNDCLKYLEDLTTRSMKFLKPTWKRKYMGPTVRSFKHESRDWVVLGDWPKFFWKPDNSSEKGFHLFDSLQANLSRLLDRYLKKRGRTTKRFRRNLWRTVEHIPGHLSMPYYPKRWYSRFSNEYLWYPKIDVKYNYSYYNYIGWRNNRAHWRRYAFTPGNVNDKVFEYNRSLQRRDYNLYRRWQKRRRFVRVFQF